MLWHCPWMGEATITSGNDGKHMGTSKHYRDGAVDFRTWSLVAGERRYIDDEPEQMEAIVADWRKFLGSDFQVVWHTKDHAHIEFDP